MVRHEERTARDIWNVGEIFSDRLNLSLQLEVLRSARIEHCAQNYARLEGRTSPAERGRRIVQILIE